MPSFNDLCTNTLPEGVYKVQVTDITIKKSAKDAETNDLVVHYMITEGPLAKKTLVDTIYEKSFSWRLKPFLEACGIDLNREFATTKELFEYCVSNVKGKVIMIELGTRMYNGAKYNNINKFSPLPGSTTSADEVANLVNKLGIGDVPTSLIVNETPITSPKDNEDVVAEPKVDFSLNLDDESIF